MSEEEAHVVYSATVEGLRRAIGDRLDERAHEKLAALGIPLEGKLAAAYPRNAWIAVSLYAGELLNPGMTPSEQRVALGRRFVRGYAETVVGGALLTALRILGPRRALARFERNMRTGTNYARTQLREVDGGLLELDIINAPYPEWYEGMVREALEVTGARDVKLEVVKLEPPAITTYRVSFR